MFLPRESEATPTFREENFDICLLSLSCSNITSIVVKRPDRGPTMSRADLDRIQGQLKVAIQSHQVVIYTKFSRAYFRPSQFVQYVAFIDFL